MSPRAHRLPRRTARPQNVARTIAVASGKGGVGKSTIAAMVAIALSHQGQRVGLLDADIYGPSVPTLFDAHEVQLETEGEQTIIPVRLKNGLQLVSFGFILGDAPAVMRGPMVSRYINQLLLDVAWDALDTLIIDLPPGTGDVQLTITQDIAIDGALIVTTPHALSYSDVGKAILMFERVAVPIIGIVENMAWFVCPQCDTRHALFAAHSATKQRLTDRFGIPVITQVPLAVEQYGGVHHDDASVPVEMKALATRLIDFLSRQDAEEMRPQIELTPDWITLRWGDGEVVRVGHHALRAECRCILCIDERSGAKRGIIEAIDPDVHALDVQPLGNYALYIRWSDGHSTGFFPYRLIRQIGERLPQ